MWLPTVDSVNESHEREAPAGAKVPVWVKLQLELREQGIEIEPVPVVDDAGAVLPRDPRRAGAHRPSRAAARHRASGPRRDLRRRRRRPARRASTEIVITHPEFPAQSLSVADQVALAERGALLERCMTTPHTGKIAWEQWIANIREAGHEHSVLSTDLGQVFNPPVEDGMGIMVDHLLAAGFSDEEVHVMAVVNSRRVAGAQPL